MKNQNKKTLFLTKDTKNFKSIIETIIDSEEIIKIIENSYYEKSMQNLDNADVNINHLENIFTNETYYLAMKIVPLIEKKILYLSFVENNRLNDICKKLKLQRNEVITLRNKGITHFKNNLRTLYKAENIKTTVVTNEKRNKYH